MTRILILGAGRSSTSLIEYLAKHSGEFNWTITVADLDLNLAEQKIAGLPNCTAVNFDSRNDETRKELIQNSDLVISMLPAFMHHAVAKHCLKFSKHLATASYASPEIRAMEKSVKRKKLLFLNECGLDPGLDHASAMKTIDEIRSSGGKLLSFRSYCGGLVAPESNNNPWGYKFSWNPRNVVLAGQGTAQYFSDGVVKFIPYNRLFTQTEAMVIDGYGEYEAYANRDSLSYMNVYGIPGVRTMFRGTLRQKGYCKGWNVFVKLGLTDDTCRIGEASNLTYADLISSFLPSQKGSVIERLKDFAGAGWDEDIAEKIESLEICSDRKITLDEGTPAQILQKLLEEKWKLMPGDKDMIIMRHVFEHQTPENENIRRITSTLVVKGSDQRNTAMSLTVGLPLAITVKNFLTGKFNHTGVQLPVHKDMYEPMLKELGQYGIRFKEAEETV